MSVRFSIIIPVKGINGYIRETVPYIQAFPRDDWELIILPNRADPDEWQDDRIQIELVAHAPIAGFSRTGFLSHQSPATWFVRYSICEKIDCIDRVH